MSYTHVHTPIRIGGVLLRNRIVRPAHATCHGKGWISDDLIAYHEARARGGAALSILEVGSVHPTSPLSINAWDPALGPGYRKLVQAVRPHGMKLFQQLWHGGNAATPLDGSPPWSASDVANVEVGVVPIAMSSRMIGEIIESYADVARRCEEYGLDGVEVHCGHGYLPAQFLSPNTNRRDDAYGGGFENRSRFIVELLTAVRGAVSAAMAVGVRIAPDLAVGGVGAEDSLRIAQLLEARGLVDYVNISLGDYQTFSRMVAGMHEPAGYQVASSGPISRAIAVPTIITGRYGTLDDADQAIRAGDADMVGMVRGMIADPELVAKSLEGRSDEVRPCIGCNQGCVAGMQMNGHVECTVNPAVGHERTIGDDRLVRASVRRRILVVGGGPAGLEAARVAAMRGHDVVLAEAAPDLGGDLRAASGAPTRHAMLDIARWHERELYRLGVDVRLSTFVEIGDVLEIGADAVILASGSSPRMDGIQLSHPGQPIEGFAGSNAISSRDLLLGYRGAHGGDAVVIDDAGHYEGLAAAEWLFVRGWKVTYVTRHRELAPRMQAPFMNEPFLKRVSGTGFRSLVRTRVIAIRKGEVVAGPAHLSGTEPSVAIPADLVVFVSLNRPNRDLAPLISAQGMRLHVVGDALSPRYLQAAIREGHLAGATV